MNPYRMYIAKLFIYAKPFLGFTGLSSAEKCFQIERYFILIGYSNSVFNPLLYTFLGHNFGKRLSDSWKKTRTRIEVGSRMITNGHWRSTTKVNNLFLIFVLFNLLCSCKLRIWWKSTARLNVWRYLGQTLATLNILPSVAYVNAWAIEHWTFVLPVCKLINYVCTSCCAILA